MKSKSNNIPEPPTPPEMRLSCGFCNYTAPESEYNQVHKHCWPAISVIIVLVTGVSFVVLLLFYRILQSLGVI